jgi:hypothetical protein
MTMQSNEITFSRTLLTALRADLEKHKLQIYKDATVVSDVRASRRNCPCVFEFHGPRGFYWTGMASSSYEARFKGWHAYLESKGLAATRAAPIRMPMREEHST